MSRMLHTCTPGHVSYGWIFARIRVIVKQPSNKLRLNPPPPDRGPRDLILNSVRYRTNLKHQPDQGRATTGAHDAPPAPCRVDASAAIIVHTYEPLPFR